MFSFAGILKFIRSCNSWSCKRRRHIQKQPCCMCCGSCHKPEVHHIIPVSVDASKELDPSNLITLCRTCHFVFGHLMDFRSWNTNVLQDVANYSNKIKHRPYLS